MRSSATLPRVLPSRSILALGLVALATACARPAAAPSAEIAPAASAAAPASAKALSPPGRLSLGERLAREASSRPAGALRAEAVAGALASGGVPLGPLKQVLAATVGARYCAAARSAAGAGVVVCEFSDEAAAARGMAVSRETFDRLIPGRRLARTRNAVLTLTPAEAGPRFESEAGRAAAIFAAL